MNTLLKLLSIGCVSISVGMATISQQYDVKKEIRFWNEGDKQIINKAFDDNNFNLEFNDKTPLELAIEHGNLNLAKYLLDNGATPSLCATNEIGFVDLYRYFTKNKDLNQLFDLLSSKGWDKNEMSFLRGAFSFSNILSRYYDYAFRNYSNKYIDIIKSFVNYGIGIHGNILDHAKQNAKPNLLDILSKAPVLDDTIIWDGDVLNFDKPIKPNGKINIKNLKAITQPLNYFTNRGKFIVEAFLKGDINAENSVRPVVSCALHDKSAYILRYVLECGARPSLVSRSSPYGFLLANFSEQIYDVIITQLDLLLHFGLDINEKSYREWTILDGYIEAYKEEIKLEEPDNAESMIMIIKYLIDKGAVLGKPNPESEEFINDIKS